MPQSMPAEPLARMVRSIALQKRTGVLRVEQLGCMGVERGEIYFENGTLVRARAGQEMGKAALQRIGEWKQITCAFQSVSRPPYGLAVSDSARSAGSSNSSQPPQQHASASTGDLASLPTLRNGPPSEEHALPFTCARERHTHPLDARQAESAFPNSARSEPLSLTQKQALILHRTKLETYTPEPLSSSVRSAQRWTTHQEAVSDQLPRVPPTPRLGPLPGLDILPGRLAIFKVRSLVPVAKAIHQMERHVRVIFILLDGNRTIQDIARLTHRAEHEIEHILMDLTQRGYTQYLRG